MRYVGLWRLAAFPLVLAALVDTGPAPTAATCLVTRVIDGDTLHLTCNGQLRKIRLLGYDTPEIYHPHCPAEKRAGEAATARLRDLASAGPVTGVRFQGQDRYGRDLATVAIAGQDVATHMLASRLARPYQGHVHPDWCDILGA